MLNKVVYTNTIELNCSDCGMTYYIDDIDTRKCGCDSLSIRTHEAKGFVSVHDPDDYLFSQGRYRTKILESDLPEWYVKGYFGGGRHGWLSAKDVKYLLYEPNYHVKNHCYKYDNLYISYSAPIIYEDVDGQRSMFPEGYDYVISRNFIVDFVEAVEKYSDVEVSQILSELHIKREWFNEHNPEYANW